MKTILYSLIALLLLSACQGRGLTLHPLTKGKSERGQNTKEDINTSGNFPILTLKSKTITGEKAIVANESPLILLPRQKNKIHDLNLSEEILLSKLESGLSNPLPTDKSTKTHDLNLSEEILLSKIKRNKPTIDKSLLSSIPIVSNISSSLLPSINSIPILNKIKKLFPKSSGVAKSRVKKVHKNFQTESFSGGSIVNGLDIGLVRLGQSHTYTRLIFDSYKWEGYAQIPVQKVNHSGTYIFTYDAKHKIITAILDGYQAFSALVGNHDDLYKDNTMVSTIHLDEYLDKSGFKFTIELKQEARIKVFELHNPARIVIDMYPL